MSDTSEAELVQCPNRYSKFDLKKKLTLIYYYKIKDV